MARSSNNDNLCDLDTATLTLAVSRSSVHSMPGSAPLLSAALESRLALLARVIFVLGQVLGHHSHDGEHFAARVRRAGQLVGRPICQRDPAPLLAPFAVGKEEAFPAREASATPAHRNPTWGPTRRCC